MAEDSVLAGLQPLKNG